MGEVIQLQGDQRKDVQEFLVDKKEGLELDAKTIKVCLMQLDFLWALGSLSFQGPWILGHHAARGIKPSSVDLRNSSRLAVHSRFYAHFATMTWVELGARCGVG